MTIYSFMANPKSFRNFAIVLTSREALQYLKLAIGQLLLVLLLFYDRFGIWRNNAPPICDSNDSVANSCRGCVFEKQAIYARIIKLFAKRGGRYASHNGKFRFRRPFLTRQINFKSIRARHAQIQNRAVGFQALNHRNCLNTIGRNTHDVQFWRCFQSRFHAFGNEGVIFGDDNSLCHGYFRPTIKSKCKFKQITIILFTGLFIGLSAGTACADDRPILRADGPVSSIDLTQYITYYDDAAWTKTVTDLAGPDADLFLTVPKKKVDFGYTKSLIWLRLDIENVSEEVDQWRLHFRENFEHKFDVYIARKTDARMGNTSQGGGADQYSMQQIMALDINSPFKTRSVPYPELVAPLKIMPGETITVYVSYYSGGSSHLDISLHTAETFSQTAIRRMVKNLVSYGIMLFLIIAGCIAALILRQTVFLAYIAYASSTLLFLAHSDGVAFQYLWPNFPVFNSVASVFIGGAVIIFCSIYTRIILNTKHYHPWFDKIFIILIVLTVIIPMVGAFIDMQWLKRLMIALSFLCIVLCATAGFVAGLTRFREVRFFILAWSGAVVSSALMNLRHVFGLDIPQDLQFDSIRVAMIFDAFMLGLAIADNYNQLRKSRQNAMEKSLYDAKRTLELNTRFYDLEQQFTLAVEMAHSRDEELQNTVHDLRQPLQALRLNVEKLKDAEGQDSANAHNFDEAFSYLETLISDQLQKSIYSSDVIQSSPPISKPVLFDNASLNVPSILKSVHEMFLPDAAAKGLEFKYFETEYDAEIDPLTLMRIMTNLVSNAIKYTPSGKILLGSRHSKTGLRIELHDTGLGMTPQEFEIAQARDIRLINTHEMAEGYGYGLAIARELVEKRGLKLYLAKNRHSGTGIILEIPF